MTNKWLNYLAAFLVLVFYLLATVGGNSNESSSAALARYPEADCRPNDVFLPLTLSDHINYFPGTQEIEPNNSYQEANGLLVSGVAYTGLFDDERDFFSIYVQTPGQIALSLNTTVNQNVQFQLFYQSINNRVGYDPSAPYQITHNGQPGWYYIFIYSGNSYPTPPNYILTATYPIPSTPTPHTPAATPTCSPTNASTSTFTATPTKTNTPTQTPLSTGTSTSTPTPTRTPTPTNTATSTPTPTATIPAGWYEVGVNSASGGGISNNSSLSYYPAAAVAPDGTVYVVWQDDNNGNNEIYVLRWNGSSWTEVGVNSASEGGISNNTGNSGYPSIAIASDNTPYVAWEDVTSGDYEIYVRRWNGSSWVEIGTNSASAEGISSNTGTSDSASIAIAPDNTPYITWADGTSGDFEIYVRRWNGSSWIEVGTNSASGGGISTNTDQSWNPKIAIASNNTPYIAWWDETTGSGGNKEIYIRSWNGSSWATVGSGSASGGGISTNTGVSYNPSIAIASNNNPYVTWSDNSSGNFEIYVRRWNGSSWEQVGANSASGVGISNTAGSSNAPTIAITPNDTPYIAWNDGSSDIWVRRWNGTIWAEVGTNSASGGGISNNSGDSDKPAIAMMPGTIPYIAWGDNSGGNPEIYIRRWLE